MKRKANLVLFISLFVLSEIAFAEGNCPGGMVPIGGGGAVGCMPIDGGQNTAPAQPRGRWLTRWGAIAIDRVNGLFGAVTDYPNKRDAKNAAIAQCKANGGAACEFKLTYYNQCAVIAWGDSSYIAQSKETVKAASELALPDCSKSTKNCRIVYADCSLPVWVE